MSKRTAIREAMEDAALAGAVEMKHFLDTYRGDDPIARVRVQVAANAVNSYTRQCSSENNMVGMMLSAAERTGVSPEQTLAIVKEVGLLPPSTVPAKLKIAK
jgi:hypothetical protein